MVVNRELIKGCILKTADPREQNGANFGFRGFSVFGIRKYLVYAMKF